MTTRSQQKRPRGEGGFHESSGRVSEVLIGQSRYRRIDIYQIDKEEKKTNTKPERMRHAHAHAFARVQQQSSTAQQNISGANCNHY